VQRGATQSFALHETPSSDGKIVAAVEYRMSNVGLPDSTESFRIVTREGSDTRVLVPDTRPFVIVWTAIIAWGKQDKSLYYLDTRPDSTTLYNITLDGKRTKRWTQPSLFAKPCPPLRECQFTTPGGRFALLVRSSNTHPGELVRVDLESGAILPLTTENDRFVHTPHPEVRFYRVENVEGDAWGRLYLPLSYERGRRYPVVFTQYVSSPGFGSDIGDEVPFMPLTAAGIAVFDMNSNSLAAQGNPGDVDTYVQRVQRPMKGMQWIARKLADEGIVDANRIGLAGLSYGAEIALYSWWNWKALRAVSVASAAWDPQLFYLGGPGYVSSVFNQGLPVPEENTMAAWRRVTAGMHARSDSTPLLIQSGDEEENFTVPAWSRMRQVGAPVEWLEYPQEGHAKVHPAARWWVYQRNLDWFRFWLQDEENVSARKPDHYERWRAMRDARNASH
jgi:dipeptidyl aminopeptidase/acylaminoacyl peptidase